MQAETTGITAGAVKSPYEVRFWDGSKFEAVSRPHAIDIARTELRGWMEEGDRIAWYNSMGSRDLVIREHDTAVVVDSLGEDTDALCRIVFVGGSK